MPFRTTDELIRKVIEVDEDVDLEPFILPANELVTELCDAPYADSDDAYSEERLELIERWLSAHFYTVLEGRTSFEKASRVSQSIESKVDLGFNLSKYGQTAMRLDTKGGLAALDRRSNSASSIKGNQGVITATAYWLGKTDAELQKEPKEGV